MKHYIKYILFIALIWCLAGCNDDFAQFDTEEAVYTLRLGIDGSSSTRGVNTVPIVGVKTQWCYGDEVTLSSSASANYTFRVAVPTGKNAGDPVEGEAVFTYSGAPIPNWNSFTDTLTYSDDATKNDKMYTGCTAMSNIGAYATAMRNIDCYKYALQLTNDNADHLKSIEHLSACLTNVNMQTANITMKRDVSILKVVLDDIYYDLYGGSVLFVDGFTPVVTGSAPNLLAMVLGEGIMSENKTPTTYGANTYRLNNPQDPRADLSVEPFYTVSTEKQPFTGYAQRDEDHKLVVYIPIFGEREVKPDAQIKVYLRDSWSTDWYMWESDAARSFKLAPGSVYTLDFTQKIGGEYIYESFAAINLGYSHLFGLFGTKNIGANKPSDVGNYYMFGHDKPIEPGGHYPSYPDATAYYFYTNVSNKDYLGYNNKNGNIGEKYPFVEPSSYGNGDAVLSKFALSPYTANLSDIWRLWLPELNKMPSFMGTWTLPQNANPATIRSNNTLIPTIIGLDGQETNDCTNPAGVRLRNGRTSHCIYIPVSGILKPSLINNDSQHTIEPEAVAQIKEGTEQYAMFTGQYLYLPPLAEGKDVKLIEYVCNAGVVNTPKDKMYFDLTDAVPIRPGLWERELNEIFTAIPGWTGSAH